MRNGKFAHIVAVSAAVVAFMAFPCSLRASHDSSMKQALAYVPEAVISLSSECAIIVDKEGQTLSVLRSEDGRLYMVFEVPCSTGRNRGPKQVSGDGKTPEGILFVTKAYCDRELSSTYGIMAFHLNYPTLIDRRAGRDGNNIWIHGTDKPLKPFKSNGCITLTNTDIQRLSHYIALNRTPVIIKDYVRWRPDEEMSPLKKELEIFLDTWCDAVSMGDRHALEPLYKQSTSMDTTTLHPLVRHIRKWKARGDTVSLRPHTITLLQHPTYVTASFEQILTVGSESYRCGHRTLFLRKNPDTWHVIGDEFRSPLTTKQLFATLERIDRTVVASPGIRRTIEKWLHTWEVGDMTGYASFYSRDFRARGMNLKQWVSYKKNLRRFDGNITIQIEDLETSQSPEIMTATFIQKYHSSRHSDTGIKRLGFKKVNNQWKIYTETWSPEKH